MDTHLTNIYLRHHHAHIIPKAHASSRTYINTYPSAQITAHTYRPSTQPLLCLYQPRLSYEVKLTPQLNAQYNWTTSTYTQLWWLTLVKPSNVSTFTVYPLPRRGTLRREACRHQAPVSRTDGGRLQPSDTSVSREGLVSLSTVVQIKVKNAIFRSTFKTTTFTSIIF